MMFPFRTCVYQPPLTPLPNWVFEMYDAKCLAEKVHSSLEKIKLFSETTTSGTVKMQSIFTHFQKDLYIFDH